MRAPLLLSRCAHGSQHGSPAYARLSAHARLRRLRLPPPTAPAAYGSRRLRLSPPTALSLAAYAWCAHGSQHGSTALAAYGSLARSLRTVCTRLAARLCSLRTAFQPTHGSTAYGMAPLGAAPLHHGYATLALRYATLRHALSPLHYAAWLDVLRRSRPPLRYATLRRATLCYATLR